MKRAFIHNPFFRLIAPPVLGVIVYMLVLLIRNNLADVNQLFSNEELYITMVVSYLSLETLRLCQVSIKKFNLEFNKNQILLSIFISTPISLLIVTLSLMAYFRWIVGFDIGMDELAIFWFLFGFSALLYNLLYFSNEYLLRENTLLLEQENKLKEKMEYDFMVFRNEINPDLLYESLETLLTSIHTRTEEAESQIDLLADVYRYQLVNRKKELVSWDQEIKALKSLCSLLNYRYGNTIFIKIETDISDHFHVVPGSLIIAFDAVVRNTLIAKESPLEVNLYMESDEYLVMQHKLNDKLILHQDSLNNFARLQRAYSFFSDYPFVQVKADHENYIKFPMVKVSESSIIEQQA
jgi:Histidine kinase